MGKVSRNLPAPPTIKVNAPFAAGPAGIPFYGTAGGVSNGIFGSTEELPPLGIIVPPGGFAGFSQQTPATQALFARGAGRPRSGPRRRRARSAGKSRPRLRARASRRARGKPARLVKGSAAAKRYMASIRRKRKR